MQLSQQDLDIYNSRNFKSLLNLSMYRGQHLGSTIVEILKVY